MEEKTCQYSKEEVRAYIFEVLPFPDLISALKKCNYDLNRFFSEYNDAIQDEAVYITLLTHFKQDLSDYWVDLANGHWNVLHIGSGKLSDIARSLWFAHTDTDIWNIVITLPPTVAWQLYRCYTGEAEIEGFFPVYLKNPEKANEMIEYLQNHMRDYIQD